MEAQMGKQKFHKQFFLAIDGKIETILKNKIY